MTSIRGKINLVFSVTLLLLASLFWASLKYDMNQYQELTEAQERAISHYLYSYFLKTGKIDEAYLEAQNMSVISDKNSVIQIERYFKDKGKVSKYAVDTIHLKRIILINNDRFKLILENKNIARSEE
ncbi:MAG TPA: sensor histidine kinase, partial [Epsilonproteobacteria bacterium]|nr:sensor histidine kinase [Campylobacterota bacterium]